MPKSTIDAHAFLEETVEADAIHIDLGDGSDPIVVPPAVVWADEYDRKVQAAVSGKSTDILTNEQLMRWMIGDDETDRFLAVDGFTPALFHKIFAKRKGLTAGESAASLDS